MTKPHTDDWWQDRDETLAFAHVLADTFTRWSAKDAIYYFEKPWKWTPEHANWCAGNRAETLHECPDLREASETGSKSGG